MAHSWKTSDSYRAIQAMGRVGKDNITVIQPRHGMYTLQLGEIICRLPETLNGHIICPHKNVYSNTANLQTHIKHAHPDIWGDGPGTRTSKLSRTTTGRKSKITVAKTIRWFDDLHRALCFEPYSQQRSSPSVPGEAYRISAAHTHPTQEPTGVGLSASIHRTPPAPPPTPVVSLAVLNAEESASRRSEDAIVDEDIPQCSVCYQNGEEASLGRYCIVCYSLLCTDCRFCIKKVRDAQKTRDTCPTCRSADFSQAPRDDLLITKVQTITHLANTQCSPSSQEEGPDNALALPASGIASPYRVSPEEDDQPYHIHTTGLQRSHVDATANATYVNRDIGSAAPGQSQLTRQYQRRARIRRQPNRSEPNVPMVTSNRSSLRERYNLDNPSGLTNAFSSVLAEVSPSTTFLQHEAETPTENVGGNPLYYPLPQTMHEARHVLNIGRRASGRRQYEEATLRLATLRSQALTPVQRLACMASMAQLNRSWAIINGNGA